MYFFLVVLLSFVIPKGLSQSFLQFYSVTTVVFFQDTRKNLMISHIRLGHPDEEFSMNKLEEVPCNNLMAP